jgi:hypothetical protein
MIWHALFDIGLTVITCQVMEAYHQRRATEKVHDYDEGME